MLCQIFNFIDTIGGKAGITHKSKFRCNSNILIDIEKMFKVRGLLEPSSAGEA